MKAIFTIIFLGGCSRLPHDAQKSFHKAVHYKSAAPDFESNSGQPPVMIEIDEKTAKPRMNLVLRLDYFPENSGVKKTRNFPKCLSPLDSDEEIGVLYCDGQAGTRRGLYARMVDQDCYTGGGMHRRSGQEILTFERCRSVVALLHQFLPPIRLDLEPKN